MLNVEYIWQQFLLLASQEVGSRVVETWIKALTLSVWDVASKTAYLQAPNAFVRDWVQNKYMSLIELHLARMLHVPTVKLVISLPHEQIAKGVSDQSPKAIIPAVKLDTAPVQRIEKKRTLSVLKPEYIFDNFVVGANNSLSYAAAYAVAQNVDRVYNPLFIYGSSGVGKTHLLHAIGNEVRKNRSNQSVLYQSADRFVSEFIHAIRFENIDKFQHKYQSVDVLLIDDIQCIANKEQTQEAFFNIFNVLYDTQKQIVFSSDTYPQNLHGVTERLRSRMAWGLVTDMYIPNLETKVAILKSKADNHHKIVLTDEVAEFIASCVVSNVRELEGALIRVIAYAHFVQKPVTLELAQSVLSSQAFQSKNKEVISFETILNAMKATYGYDRALLCSKGRNKELSHARHIAMYLMKKMTNKSLRDIGSFLGDRDHATIKYGIEKITDAIASDPALKKDVSYIEQLLK